MIKNIELKNIGHTLTQFPIDPQVILLRDNQKWKELDQYFLEISKPGGKLRYFLEQFLDFNHLEHIISIRRAPEDEDGIWHDDGSRHLGFSLSLNKDISQISGGDLRIKNKGAENITTYSPRPCGQMILFLSGLYNLEHMVSAVKSGERIVIAGWCS